MSIYVFPSIGTVKTEYQKLIFEGPLPPSLNCESLLGSWEKLPIVRPRNFGKVLI